MANMNWSKELFFFFIFEVNLCVKCSAEEFFVKLGEKCDLSSSYSSSAVESLIQCCTNCALQDECRSSSYREDTGQCNLHSFISSGCTTTTNGDWIVMKRKTEGHIGNTCSFNTSVPVVNLRSQCGDSYLKSPLIFTVMACDLARINLRAAPDELYFVDLGKRSFIRFISGGSSDDSPEVSASLNCAAHMPFWIKWELNGEQTAISYGRGETAGSNLIASREDEWNMVFTEAYISTMGGNNGTWTFYER